MVMSQISEPEWKVFRQLHPITVERFCAKVLAELESIVSDSSKSHHERYGDIYGLMLDRNKEMARAFDDFRRSNAVDQIAMIEALGLLTEEEIGRFSPETRRILDFYARLRDV